MALTSTRTLTFVLPPVHTDWPAYVQALTSLPFGKDQLMFLLDDERTTLADQMVIFEACLRHNLPYLVHVAITMVDQKIIQLHLEQIITFLVEDTTEEFTNELFQAVAVVITHPAMTVSQQQLLLNTYNRWECAELVDYLFNFLSEAVVANFTPTPGLDEFWRREQTY